LLFWLGALWLNALSINPNWVQDYDYHTPENAISAVTVGMGGLNLTNAGDYFGFHDNPALLQAFNGSAAATSFIVKSGEPLTFSELLSARSLLKDKQFLYFSVITKKSGWSYQPVANVHISTWDASHTNSEYFDYQLDKLQLSVAASDENYSSLAGGLNIKYLTGRLVYLKERLQGSNLIRESFIDDKVKGLSSDLGFTWTEGQYVWGATFYDYLSRMWWENYDSKSLKRRASFGFQYNMDNLALLAALQGRISSDPGTTYHFGLIKNWSWKTGNSTEGNQAEQNLLIRMGLYSKNFDGTKNINYTFGSGYNYNLFRVDFSLTNSGMQLKESQYLFTVGAGIQ